MKQSQINKLLSELKFSANDSFLKEIDSIVTVDYYLVKAHEMLLKRKNGLSRLEIIEIIRELMRAVLKKDNEDGPEEKEHAGDGHPNKDRK